MKSVPRELSSDCGYCIEIDHHTKDKASAILEEKYVEIDQIVDI